VLGAFEEAIMLEALVIHLRAGRALRRLLTWAARGGHDAALRLGSA